MNHLKLALSFVILALPMAAHATIVRAPSDDELVAGADVIGLAVVERLEVVVSRTKQIMTHVELRIERGVRGVADGDFVAAEYPGGQLSNARSRVAGAPELEVGQRTFVYLRASGGALRPIGLRYGMLEVARHKDGSYRASRRLDGLSFAGSSGVSRERYVLRDVAVETLIEDAQARMRRLHLDAGRARLVPRGPSASAVRR